MVASGDCEVCEVISAEISLQRSVAYQSHTVSSKKALGDYEFIASIVDEREAIRRADRQPVSVYKKSL